MSENEQVTDEIQDLVYGDASPLAGDMYTSSFKALKSVLSQTNNKDFLE
jgi:hypothetical protein